MTESGDAGLDILLAWSDGGGVTIVAAKRHRAPRALRTIAVTADHDRVADDGSDDADWNRWWRETGEFELRQLLYWRWDPLGVASAFPWAADEYDCYAPQIATVLRVRPSAADVAGELLAVERELMALPNSVAAAAARDTVAAAIVEWCQDSRARWWQFGPRPR